MTTQRDKLLILTDLHITEPGSQIIGLDPGERFRAALDHALQTHPDARGVVLLGDLTHHGRPAQYARLGALLADSTLPVWATIGNHDDPTAFAAAFPDQLMANNFACHAFEACGTRVIILDTHDRHGHAPRHGGWLCGDRLAWLDQQLATATGPVLLACHHPPFDTGFPGMDAIRLANGATLMDRLVAHPAPVHMVCGHVHRTISGSVRGIGFTVLKSPCHQMPMDLDSPDSALSIDEPGAYGIALLQADGVIVHSEDVGLPSCVARDEHSAAITK